MVVTRTVRLAVTALAALLLPLAFWSLMGSSVLMGDLIVVGKEYERVSDLALVCVSYRAYGRTERSCVPATSASTGAFTQCVKDARIGRPLPESCQ